jgi:hypothetical protein
MLSTGDRTVEHSKNLPYSAQLF